MALTAPKDHNHLVDLNTKTTITKSRRRSSLLELTGFTKGYNFIFFALTAGVFGLWCLDQIRNGYLNYDTWLRLAVPGQWYNFSEGIEALAMKIHICSVLPSGALMPLQFLPIIRRKYINLHRWNGRIVNVLLLFGNLSALGTSRRAFNGTITTIAGVVVVALLNLFAMLKGTHGILNLRLDVHRAWMIRLWAYAGIILSIRIVLVAIMLLNRAFAPTSYKTVQTCQQLISTYNHFRLGPIPLENLFSKYPMCRDLVPGADPIYVIVNAVLDRTADGVETTVGILELVFGPAIWISTVIHTLAVEIYLNYTTDEDTRLKAVSALKRKAAGYVDASAKKREVVHDNPLS